MISSKEALSIFKIFKSLKWLRENSSNYMEVINPAVEIVSIAGFDEGSTYSEDSEGLEPYGGNFGPMFPDDFINSSEVIFFDDRSSAEDFGAVSSRCNEIIEKLKEVDDVIKKIRDLGLDAELNVDEISQKKEELDKNCKLLKENLEALGEEGRERFSIVLEDGANAVMDEVFEAPQYATQIIAETFKKNKPEAPVEPSEPAESEKTPEEVAAETEATEVAEGEEGAAPPQEDIEAAYSKTLLESYRSLDTEEYKRLFSPRKKGPPTFPNLDGSSVSDPTTRDKYMSFVAKKNEKDSVYEKIKGIEERGKYSEEYGGKSFLEFDGSIFYGKFENMEDAIGINIIESSIGTDPLIEVDDEKVAATLKVVTDEMERIIELSKKLYPLTGKVAREVAEDINIRRRILINDIEYLFASINQRDKEVASYMAEMYPKSDILTKVLIKHTFMDPEIESGSLLRDPELERSFIKAVLSVVRPELVSNILHKKKERDFREKYGVRWVDDGLRSEYNDVVAKNAIKKIKSSFYDERIDLVTKDLYDLSASYLVAATSDRKLDKAMVKKVLKLCSVCGKEVWSDNYLRRRNVKASEKASNNLQVEQYSLFRDIGFLEGRSPMITLEELISHGRFVLSSEDSESIREALDSMGLGARISAGKTWEEIEQDYYSGNYAKNIESIMRKNYALKSLGGKKLPATFNLAVSRFRCPFGSEKEAGATEAGQSAQFDTKSALRIIERANKSLYAKDKVKDKILAIQNKVLESGASHDEAVKAVSKVIDELKWLEDKSKTAAKAALKGQVSFRQGGAKDEWNCGLGYNDQAQRGLELYLEEAEGTGAISKEQKEKIIALSSEQSLGGFKFSARSFVCPTEIDASGEDALDLIDKHKMLVVPIRSKVGQTEHPATAAVLGGGKILSLRCGAPTSISQFDRMKFYENIKDLVDEKNHDDYMNLVNSMIELGVDVTDILPFTMLKHANNEDLTDVTAGLLLSDGGISDAAIFRMNKISGLLKQAMATTGTGAQRGQLNVSKYFDYIQNIELNCIHGHSFSPGQSVAFTKEFIDINFDLKTKEQIVRRNILAMSGEEQLKGILELSGSPIIRRLNIGEKARPYSSYKYGDRIADIGFGGPDAEGSDLIYADKAVGKNISMYPGADEIYTIPNKASIIRTKESTVTLRSEYGRGKSSSTVGKSDDKGITDIMNTVKDQGPSPDALLESSGGQGLSKASIMAGMNSAKLQETIILALIQSNITTIQELLLTATSTSKEDVSFFSPRLAGKTISEKIGSKEFLDDLRGLIDFVFREKLSEDALVMLGEKGQAEDGLKESIYSSVKERIIRDIGSQEVAYAYASRKVLLNYFYEVIISSFKNLAGSLGNEDFSVSVEAIGSLTPEELSNKLPSFFSLKSIEEFEVSDSVSDFAKILTDPKGSPDQMPKPMKAKVMNITELWFGKQLVISATAFYMAESLLNIYDRFFNKESVDYLGYNPLRNFQPKSVNDIIKITISDALMGISEEPSRLLGIYEEMMEKVASGEDMGQLAGSAATLVRKMNDAANELGRAHHGAEYACRTEKYQGLGLEYIKAVYAEALSIEDSSDPHVEKILNNVLTNTRNISVSLSGEDEKYSGYYAKFENAHTLLPPTMQRVLEVDEKKTKLTKPVYVIYAPGLNDDEPYPFGIRPSLVKGRHYAFLVHNDDAQYFDQITSLESSKSFAEEHEAFYQNGWRLYLGGREAQEIYKNKDISTKGKRVESSSVSLIDHPGTYVVYDEFGDRSGYANDTVGLRTDVGFHIGTYGAWTKKSSYGSASKFYPPMPNADCGVGIPIPISIPAELDNSEKKVRGSTINISMCDIPVDLPTESGEFLRANISDLMMRRPPELASKMLFEIEKEHANFKKEYGALFRSGADESELEKYRTTYIMGARRKMDRYRSLPLNVIMDSNTRTHMNAKGGFSLALGAYAPLVDPITANRFLTQECFSQEYAGHRIFGDEVDPELAKSSIRSFLVSAFGYDRLADMMNEHDTAVKTGRKVGNKYSISGEPIDGEDLLFPAQMLNLRGEGGKGISKDALYGAGATTDFVLDEATGKVIQKVVGIKEFDKLKSILGPKQFAMLAPSIFPIFEDPGDFFGDDYVKRNMDKLTGVTTAKRDIEKLLEAIKASFNKKGQGTRISDRYIESFDKTLPGWRYHTPKFKHLGVTGSGDIGGVDFEEPKLVLEGPIFARSKEGPPGKENILSFRDLLPVGIQKRITRKLGIYDFHHALNKFFSKKFEGIKDYIEEYKETLITAETYGFDKESLFDPAALFKKTSSMIICSGFIKKSEKYKTDIFQEISIRDEAIIRLLDRIN